MQHWQLALATVVLSSSSEALGMAGLPEVIQTAPPALQERLNPAGRDITLGGPLTDGQFILGEVTYLLTADDRILVDVEPFLAILRPIIDPSVLETLSGAIGDRNQIDTIELGDLGFPVVYNPANFGLVLTIDPTIRPLTTISLAGGDRGLLGTLQQPAGLSGYVTAFTSADYIHQSVGGDTGFDTPNILLDSAVRYRGVVLENEATINDGFNREGTRLVYDDLVRTARWTAGDLQPISRGFSGGQPLAGLSIVRTYAELEPQRNVQPRGQRSFTLERSSTVETFINGQSVQQTRLNPGTYDVRDFPFAQGANDVRLVIRDDSGVENVISFSINFDRSLLQRGLSEFGVFVGAESEFDGSGISYTDTPAASGFYRRGVRDDLTLGANFQVSDRGGVVGGETVWASPIGTLGGDLALSSISGIGEGYALNVGYERVFGGGPDDVRSLTATFQAISENFANPGSVIATNPFAYDLGITYSQSLSETQYVSTDVFYSVGRDAEPDQRSARATYGWRANTRTLFTVEGVYEDRRGEREYGVRLALTYRFSQFSSGSAEVDSRRERARVGYQTSRGRGVQSWNASGTLERNESSTGLNAAYATLLNRGEFGATHQTSFAAEGGDISDQRTSVRLGTSLAFADGKFAVSRPIYDSFAIVRPHESLDGAPVYVEPRDEFFTARSGLLGGGVTPELSAYSPRVLTFDVPGAPTGYDIGSGSAQLLPPYRSGYLITVGSDYSVSATGQLLDDASQPVRLLVGLAYEVSNPGRPPIRMFTNGSGRFAVQGMRPGRWRIETDGTPAFVYTIDIPVEAKGLVRLGVINPEPR